MNRLTQKDEQGNWCLKGMRWEEFRPGKVLTKEMFDRLYGALWKLMEYEDTELDPDDVERLNDFEQTEAAGLLKKLHEERRKHRWIPVEQRLPDTEDNLVLIQVSRRPEGSIELDNALCLAFYNQEEGWILELFPEWEGAQPVAWMPLPDSYKGEEEP